MFEKIFEGKGFDVYPSFEANNCTNNEQCLKIEIILELTLKFRWLFEDFGTLLRNFIELSNFDSFKISSGLFDMYFEKVMFGGMSNYCENLKENEMKLHNFFSKLSNLIGFEESESISLYDIPGILSDVKSLDELSIGALPKSFYFTRCKYGHDKYDQVENCALLWKKYIDNKLFENKTGAGKTFMKLFSSLIKLTLNKNFKYSSSM